MLWTIPAITGVKCRGLIEGNKDRNGVQHHLGQAGQACRGSPFSIPPSRAAGHHISTPTAPALCLFPLVICTAAREQKCECTRLSSVHGPSSACPGGQGQPQTDPARHLLQACALFRFARAMAQPFSKAFLSFQ